MKNAILWVINFLLKFMKINPLSNYQNEDSVTNVIVNKVMTKIDSNYGLIDFNVILKGSKSYVYQFELKNHTFITYKLFYNNGLEVRLEEVSSYDLSLTGTVISFLNQEILFNKNEIEKYFALNLIGN